MAARYGHDAKALDQVGQAAALHANCFRVHCAFQCTWADMVADLLLQRPPRCNAASPQLEDIVLGAIVHVAVKPDRACIAVYSSSQLVTSHLLPPFCRPAVVSRCFGIS